MESKFEIFTLDIRKNALVDNWSYWNWDYSSRYSNFFGKVTGRENGKDVVEYMSKTRYRKDGYFNIDNTIKAGDILVAGRFDNYKHQIERGTEKEFYFVVKRTKTKLEISDNYTTYLKAKKAYEEFKAEQKELRMAKAKAC